MQTDPAEPGLSWWQRRGHHVGLVVTLGLAAWLVVGIARDWRQWHPMAPPDVPAIVREAQSRLVAHTPTATPWQSLDERQLGTLLQDARLDDAPEDARLLIVDQAAAWNLLRFDRPSDVLEQWRRLGLANGLEVQPESQPPVRLERTWVATTEWSDEAGAALALWQCLPSYAWGQREMPPLLYALKTGRDGWWASQSPVADFGGCVHRQRERAPFALVTSLDQNLRYPETDRGRRSAAVLLAKLPTFIRRVGCTTHAADDCVLLLQALASLSADPATLAPVLARIDPTFGPATVPPVLLAEPVAPSGVLAPNGSAVPSWASQEAYDRLLQAWLYLDARVAALALSAEALPEHEPAATMGRLFDVSVALAHIEQVGGMRYGHSHGLFHDPWKRVDDLARTRPDWQRALLSQGGAAAAAAGCGPLAFRSIDEALSPPQEFWLGFASRKLARVGLGCDRLPPVALARHLVRDAQDPVVSELAEVFGREAHARAHLEILGAMSGLCPLAQDPLGVCAWLGDRDAPRLHEGARTLPLKPGQAWTAQPDAQIPASIRQVPERLAALRTAWGSAAVNVLDRLPPGMAYEVSRQWLAPGGEATALLIHRGDQGADDPMDFVHPRAALLLVDSRGARLVDVTGLDENLSTLSDMDGDGNPELWNEADEGECDGDDEKPGVDCAIHRAWLAGEVFGTEVAPYLKGPWPAPPRLERLHAL